MTFQEQVQEVRNFVGAVTRQTSAAGPSAEGGPQQQTLTDTRYLAEALDATLCLLDTLSHRVATLEQDRGRSE